MKKQLIWVFEWRKSVHYWWSYILFSPECKELTGMLDPLLYRWSVPPVVIRCVHWTVQMEVLQTWIKAQGLAIVMIRWLQIFCTCHNSTVAVSFCRDHFLRIWMGEKFSFYQIWIMMEKSLVKWIYTVGCCYPMVNFPPDTHYGQSIAHPHV